MKKLYIKTYGCQMNFYDSNKISDLLKKTGYTLTENSNEADLVVLNTCHIRDKAVEKTYSDLGRIKKSIDSSNSEITLRRKIRNTYSGADVTAFSNEPFSISKWYRIGYLQGINSLYGGFSNDADDGYIYFDWAYSEEPGTSGKQAIVVRSMCDNTVNKMLMLDHPEHSWAYSYCDDHNEFKAEDEPYALTFSFSTAEDEWNGSSNVRYEKRNRMTDDVTMS